MSDCVWKQKEKFGVVFVLPVADHRSGSFNQWNTSAQDLRKKASQKTAAVVCASSVPDSAEGVVAALTARLVSDVCWQMTKNRYAFFQNRDDCGQVSGRWSQPNSTGILSFTSIFCKIVK